MSLPDNLWVGTSGWSCGDWLGSFYPAHLKPSQYLEQYARRFRMVEIDSTFYSIPAAAVVAGWKARTPPGFVFSAAVPGVITHRKVLTECRHEFTAFLKAVELLGDRLGPLLLRFPYFNKEMFLSRHQFDRVLRPFLKTLPADFSFALEIRNKNWITWDFLELLREHSVAFTVVAQAWMPPIDRLARALDLVTGAFFYVRFVGDRRAMEIKTDRWDTLREDKAAEVKLWGEEIRKIVARGVPSYVAFDNHYAGFAPGSAQLFEELWRN